MQDNYGTDCTKLTRHFQHRATQRRPKSVSFILNKNNQEENRNNINSILIQEIQITNMKMI